MPRGYRPYALDTVAKEDQYWQTSARDTSQWKCEMRESFKPSENGEWLSRQTAPRVDNPPSARPAIPSYCGHSPLVRDEMKDEITARAGEPIIRLHAPHITELSTNALSESDLSITAAARMVTQEETVVRPKHVNGYTGTLPGSMSQELGKLSTVRTCELAEELRKLSKGINAKTFAAYNILAKVPTKSANQETHPPFSIARQDKVGSRHKFIRWQSAETKYADTYSRSNAGKGPFQQKANAPP